MLYWLLEGAEKGAYKPVENGGPLELEKAKRCPLESL